jgi:hypothetical protein
MPSPGVERIPWSFGKKKRPRVYGFARLAAPLHLWSPSRTLGIQFRPTSRRPWGNLVLVGVGPAQVQMSIRENEQVHFNFLIYRFSLIHIPKLRYWICWPQNY